MSWTPGNRGAHGHWHGGMDALINGYRLARQTPPGPERDVTAEPLREARALLDRPPSNHPGLWERAAILLARQALEEALDDFWRARAPDC